MALDRGRQGGRTEMSDVLSPETNNLNPRRILVGLRDVPTFSFNWPVHVGLGLTERGEAAETGIANDFGA